MRSSGKPPRRGRRFDSDAPPAAVRVAEFLRAKLPGKVSPRWLHRQLITLGYCGSEDDARARAVVRQACLLAYEHVSRLKAIYLDGYSRLDYPAKRNMLFVGPTGSGKTYLAALLFERILHLPCVIVDCSNLTSAGYVGGDVASIPARLIQKAGGNVELAQVGIIVLDEIDKMAGRAGQHGNWLKAAAQTELLRMLQGGETTACFSKASAGGPPAPETSVRMDDVTFFACGAFSGIEELVAQEQAATSSPTTLRHGSAAVTTADLTPSVLERFGLLPELVGRFPIMCALPPLSLDTLKQIAVIELKREAVRWSCEGRLDDLRATVDPLFLDELAQDAFRRKTGARGIAGALSSHLDSLAFELFGSEAGRNTGPERPSTGPASQPASERPRDPGTRLLPEVATSAEQEPTTSRRYHWKFTYWPEQTTPDSRSFKVRRLEIQIPPSAWARLLSSAGGPARLIESVVGKHRFEFADNTMQIELLEPYEIDRDASDLGDRVHRAYLDGKWRAA